MSSAANPSPSQPALRVLIADDHPAFRSGLHAMLDTDTSVHVVGEAASGAEVLRQVEQLQPDVVLMDLGMPDMNGIDATRALASTSPATAVLILTMFEDIDSVFAALRAGARGYLVKSSERNEILGAIQAVAAGEAVFGAPIADRVIRSLTATGPARRPFPDLTDREHDVLDALATGARTEAIATALNLNPKTVRNYLSNILTKLQVLDRDQAISKARDAGLGKSSDDGGPTQPP